MVFKLDLLLADGLNRPHVFDPTSKYNIRKANIRNGYRAVKKEGGLNKEVYSYQTTIKSEFMKVTYSSSKLLSAEWTRVVFFCPLLEAVTMEGMPAVEVMHHRLYNRLFLTFNHILTNRTGASLSSNLQF